MRLLNVRSFYFMAFCFLISGCVPLNHIVANKDANYTKTPKRILVVSDVGSDFGDDFRHAFHSELNLVAGECGTTIQVIFRSPLELDTDLYAKRLQAFNADSFMTVYRAGGVLESGIFIEMNYDARLMDISSKKMVWRAAVKFRRAGTLYKSMENQGKTLAIDVTNQMKSNRLFGDCPLIIEAQKKTDASTSSADNSALTSK
jgi:hypothetical protein